MLLSYITLHQHFPCSPTSRQTNLRSPPESSQLIIAHLHIHRWYHNIARGKKNNTQTQKSTDQGKLTCTLKTNAHSILRFYMRVCVYVYKYIMDTQVFITVMYIQVCIYILTHTHARTSICIWHLVFHLHPGHYHSSNGSCCALKFPLWSITTSFIDSSIASQAIALCMTLIGDTGYTLVTSQHA